MEEVIKVSNLTRKYKDFSLGPVNLSFPKGFATALIGANGAGKTTLMDIILRNYRKDRRHSNIFRRNR